MAIGETLFIISPSNKNISKFTYHSITRHKKIKHNKFSFCILENDKNESELDKFLKILEVCRKYKDFYDVAFVLSGDCFYNSQNIDSLVDFLTYVYYTIKINRNLLLIGPLYIDEYILKNQYDQKDISNNFIVTNSIKNNFKKYIDYNLFCIALNKLEDFLPIDDFIKSLYFEKNLNFQLILNSLLLYNSKIIPKEKDIFFKKNISNHYTTREIQVSNKTYNKKLFRFNSDFFPFKKITESENKALCLINYFIFNRMYDEYKLIDKKYIDDEICFVMENYHIKTHFADQLNAIKDYDAQD